jgi:hypothetical protein
LRRFLRTSAAVLFSAAISGCAVPIVGGLTLSEMSTGASVVSTGLTGKSLSDDALGMVTGDDCSMVEGVVRADRHICETPGSPATQKDFKGILG